MRRTLAGYPPPARLGDLSSLVGDVTNFFGSIQGDLTSAQQEVAKIDHAVTGAAAGAQAGYNAPTSLSPWMIAGGVLLVVLLLRKS